MKIGIEGSKSICANTDRSTNFLCSCCDKPLNVDDFQFSPLFCGDKCFHEYSNNKQKDKLNNQKAYLHTNEKAKDKNIQHSIFRWDSEEKGHEAYTLSFFETEIILNRQPILMLRFYRILKELNLLNFSPSTITKHCKIIGHHHANKHPDCYMKYRNAMAIFDKIRKTSKFKRSIEKGLVSSLKTWENIKDSKKIECDWINKKTKKPEFNSKYWAKNVKMLTLQDIYSASEFLGKDVPKEISDKVPLLGL